jgi:hypothetical protein
MLGLRFEHWWLQLPCFAATIGGATVVLYLLHRRKDDRPSDSELTIRGDAGGDVSGYLAGYLLPFLVVGKPGWRDLAAYVTFIIVAGIVYVRSDMIQVNSLLYVLRWRVLHATIDAGAVDADVFVITRRGHRVGDSLQAERFSDRVYIDHSPRN